MQAYAQEPHRQPHGEDRVSVPRMLLDEVLGSAFDAARPEQDVVIDLYSGTKSLAPVARALGLRYISVDIQRV